MESSDVVSSRRSYRAQRGLQVAPHQEKKALLIATGSLRWKPRAERPECTTAAWPCTADPREDRRKRNETNSGDNTASAKNIPNIVMPHSSAGEWHPIGGQKLQLKLFKCAAPAIEKRSTSRRIRSRMSNNPKLHGPHGFDPTAPSMHCTLLP